MKIIVPRNVIIVTNDFQPNLVLKTMLWEYTNRVKFYVMIVAKCLQVLLCYEDMLVGIIIQGIIDFTPSKNPQKLFLLILCNCNIYLWNLWYCSSSSDWVTKSLEGFSEIGRFPIEIKTKIGYLIDFCYLKLYCKISYFSLKTDRKSTKETWIVAARSVILRPNLCPLLKLISPF